MFFAEDPIISNHTKLLHLVGGKSIRAFERKWTYHRQDRDEPVVQEGR